MSTKKDYHKNVMCNVCGKVVRDNYLKHHMSVKHADVVCATKPAEAQVLNSTHASAENVEPTMEQSVTDDCNEHNNDLETTAAAAVDDDDANLKFQLLQNNEAYKNNVNLGRKISKVLDEGIVFEESLTKQHKFCLQLFRAQQTTTDVTNAELRPWQTQLLDVIAQDQMNDRMIIWVMGRKGNEGKSWFQSYIQSLHGAHRVARFDITNKTSDLLHIMSRCSLATTDMILFNHQRCVSSEECCYSLLEMIKDGYASAPKFQGALLRIKTPNLVIVFSNREPRMHSLSLDRWKIFSIRDGKLVGGFEEQIWKQQKDDHTKAAKMHQLKNQMPRCRGATEIYDDHGKIIKRIFDEPS